MKAVRINKYAVPVLAALALLGSGWIAKAAAVWQTSGQGSILLDASGQANPEGIKGWMTLTDVSETYAVPLDALYTLIGAGPDISADTELKELEGLLPGTDVSTVRAGVAAYLDGSWRPADGPYGGTPLEGAVPTPAATATPTPAPQETPQNGGAGAGDGTHEGVVLPADGSRLPAAEVKGRMTLQEVVNYCQVPLKVLVAELGLPVGADPALPLRDLAGTYGIEVSAVRDAVQRYQDSH